MRITIGMRCKIEIETYEEDKGEKETKKEKEETEEGRRKGGEWR